MSRLAMAMHAMPSGSVVTAQLAEDQKAVNRLLDQQRVDEIDRAKALQKLYPELSWPQALRAASNHYVTQVMRPVH